MLLQVHLERGRGTAITAPASWTWTSPSSRTLPSPSGSRRSSGLNCLISLIGETSRLQATSALAPLVLLAPVAVLGSRRTPSATSLALRALGQENRSTCSLL